MQIQIAYLISNSGHRIIVPWCYRTTDLMDIFETLLPGPTLKKIATMFMSRQFEQLLHAPEIFQLLSRRCIWCDETVELKHAMAHLRVAHSFDIQRLQVIIRQLAAVATQDHQGFWCSFCGELLPSGERDDDISPLPEKHMQQCTYIKLVALMLSYPVWHKKAYQPYQWPTTNEVERAYQRMHLSLVQYNVCPSAQHDTLGAAFEPLADCGIQSLSDPQFLELAKYTCLMCTRSFFTPWKFVQHLYTHNYRQMDTHFCLHRLQLRCAEPCPFCDSSKHLPQLAGICPTLLNLATFLVNGSAEPYGRGNRYVETHPYPGPDDKAGADSQRWTAGQEAQAEQRATGQQLQAVLRRPVRDGGQTGTSNRIEPSCPSSRTPVFTAHQPGSGEHHPCHDGRDETVASDRQEAATETPPSRSHDGHSEKPSRNPDEVRPKGSSLEGRDEDAPPERNRSDALPSLGSIHQTTQIEPRGHTEHGGGGAGSAEHLQTGARSNNKAQGSTGQSGALAVAAEQQKSARDLGGSAQTVLSQHLAAYSLPNSTPVQTAPPWPKASSSSWHVDHKSVVEPKEPLLHQLLCAELGMGGCSDRQHRN